MKLMLRGWLLAQGVMMTMIAHAGSSLEGTWAGDRLRVVVDGQGATLQADCADGRIAGPIAVKADGSFSVSGSYEQHKGGPQAADAAPVSTAARFSGALSGDVLTLSILPNGAKTAQTFRLQRGASVKLVRCL